MSLIGGESQCAGGVAHLGGVVLGSCARGGGDIFCV